MLQDFGSVEQFARVVMDSHASMTHARKRRAEVLSRLAGPSLPNGAAGPDIDNVIAEAVDSLYQQIAPQIVRAVYEAKAPDAELKALVRSQIVNNTMDEIGLVDILRDGVMDALTGPCAIFKTGVAGVNDLPPSIDRGEDTDPDEFYVGLVDFDDWVIDLSGTRPGLSMFEGHRTRPNRERFLALPGVIKEEVELLSRTYGTDSGGMEAPAKSRASPEDSSFWQAVDSIEVWEMAVYEPGRTRVVTLGSSGGMLRLIREPFTHYGGERSPYHRLSFYPQPKSLLPRWFGGKLVDIHDFSRDTVRKLREKIDRLKSVNTYEAASQSVAEAIQQAKDEDWVAVARADGVSRWSGTADLAEMLPSIEVVGGLVSKAASVAPTLSQRRDYSKTATGDQLRAGAMSVQAGQMRYLIERTAGAIAKDISWFAANDDRVRGDIVVTVPGGGSVAVENAPEIREDDESSASLSMQVYTADPLDPPARTVQLFNALDRLLAYVPVGPEVFGKIARTVAMRINEPLLADLDPMQLMQASQQMVAANAPSQTRPGGPTGPAGTGNAAAPGPPAQPAQPQQPGMNPAAPAAAGAM